MGDNEIQPPLPSTPRLQLSLGDGTISTARRYTSSSSMLVPITGLASRSFLADDTPAGWLHLSPGDTPIYRDSTRHQSTVPPEGPGVPDLNPANLSEIWLIRDARMCAAWATMNPMELCAQYHPSKAAWESLTAEEKDLFYLVDGKLKEILSEYVESYDLPMPMADGIEVFRSEYAKQDKGQTDAYKAWGELTDTSKANYEKVKERNDHKIDNHIFNHPPILDVSFSYFRQ